MAGSGTAAGAVTSEKLIPKLVTEAEPGGKGGGASSSWKRALTPTRGLGPKVSWSVARVKPPPSVLVVRKREARLPGQDPVDVRAAPRQILSRPWTMAGPVTMPPVCIKVVPFTTLVAPIKGITSKPMNAAGFTTLIVFALRVKSSPGNKAVAIGVTVIAPGLMAVELLLTLNALNP